MRVEPLGAHAVREAVDYGDLVGVPVAQDPLHRDLRAVWVGGAQPTGPAGDLISVILSRGHTGVSDSPTLGA